MKQNNITNLPKLESNRLENIFSIQQTENGEYYYNMLYTVNFSNENLAPYTYDVYTTNQGDTYTLISYKMYNTINLWWLVCSLNNINNPTSLPAPGTSLKILKPSYVNTVLTAMSK